MMKKVVLHKVYVYPLSGDTGFKKNTFTVVLVNREKLMGISRQLPDIFPSLLSQDADDPVPGVFSFNEATLFQYIQVIGEFQPGKAHEPVDHADAERLVSNEKEYGKPEGIRERLIDPALHNHPDVLPERVSILSTYRQMSCGS
jgi:hypothetical protein